MKGSGYRIFIKQINNTPFYVHVGDWIHLNIEGLQGVPLLNQSTIWKITKSQGDHTCISVLGSHQEWVFLPYTSTRSTSAWLSSHTAWISGKENMKPLLKAYNHSPPPTLLQHSQWHVWNESKFNFDCCKVTPGDKIHKRTVAYCSTWGIIFFSVVDTATISPFMFSILLPRLLYFLSQDEHKNGSWCYKV